MVMEWWYGMVWNEIFCIIRCNLILWLTLASMWCVVTSMPPSWLFELCALSHVLVQHTNLITHETIHLIFPKIMLIHRLQYDLGWVFASRWRIKAIAYIDCGNVALMAPDSPHSRSRLCFLIPLHLSRTLKFEIMNKWLGFH